MAAVGERHARRFYFEPVTCDLSHHCAWVSLTLAAQIGAGCAHASTVTIHSGNTTNVGGKIGSGKVVTKNGKGHGTKTGQSPSN